MNSSYVKVHQHVAGAHGENQITLKTKGDSLEDIL